VLGGKVRRFAEILREVVDFDRPAGHGADAFPIVPADRLRMT
jgi:hypothetical protein